MPGPKPALITIPTEPIGSIPRPPDLLQKLSQVDSEDPALASLYEDAIRDTIERFEATGSRVVTDGEQKKYHNFLTYCVHGLPNASSDGFAIPFSMVIRAVCCGSREARFAICATQIHTWMWPCVMRGWPVKQAVISPSALSLMYPAEGIADYPREQFIETCCANMRPRCDAAVRRERTRFKSILLSAACREDRSFRPAPRQFRDLNNLALSRFSPEERERIGIHTCPGVIYAQRIAPEVDYADLLPRLSS